MDCNKKKAALLTGQFHYSEDKKLFSLLVVIGRRWYSLAADLVILLFPCFEESCFGLWQAPFSNFTADYISSGMWDVVGGRAGLSCGQRTFKRAGERTATSRPGLSLDGDCARNHRTPDPDTRKATRRSWQRN